jgi:thiosulfate/3-mercaptopyruvate sulfurtransferase
MALDPILPASELRAGAALVLLDCRPDAQAYAAGHLRGAFHAQLERDLSSALLPGFDPTRGGRHPLPSAQAFAQTLSSWGVTPKSHVVAYDDQAGANAAARLWWMLRAFGHQHVQVVDGGLAALIAAGHELTSEVPTLHAASPYPASAFELPLATMREVERARMDPSERVLDVRAALRFRGESEPIDPVAGHIPGAVNLPFSENLRSDKTFKSARELHEQYTQFLAGLAPEQLIVHCGSGVTACHTLLALERAGLPNAKLYVGSFSEWCRAQPALVGGIGRLPPS